jgi:hypothetical protein
LAGANATSGVALIANTWWIAGTIAGLCKQRESKKKSFHFFIL